MLYQIHDTNKSVRAHSSHGMGTIETPPDVISELPVNVIHGIMEWLPLRAAAKTSLLSKKWRDMWPTLPNLVLDSHFFRDVLGDKRYNMLEYGTLVSKILLQHNGPIRKFSIHIPRLTKEPDIHQWVSYLSRKGVTEFTLQNRCKSPLKLPSCLFSCGSLSKLKLTYCVFHPPRSFKGFRNLLSLDLKDIAFHGDVFEGIAASCPLLERLTFHNWTGLDHININAPNLKYLTIQGTFQSICLDGCRNLSSVYISLDEDITNRFKGRTQEFISFLAGSCKVEELFFVDHFVKFLAAGQVAEIFPLLFPHVKTLHLSKISSAGFAVGLIKSCPNVEKLDFTVTKIADVDNHGLGYSTSFKFLWLHTITAKLYSMSEAELNLIEFLVALSPVLEVFLVQLSTKLDTSAQYSKVLQKARRFFRASPIQKVLMMPFISNKRGDSSSESDSESESDDSDSDSDSDDGL